LLWEEGGEGTEASRPITLYLGGAPPSIRGRVLDEAGEPVAGVTVWTPDTSFFGKAVYKRGERSLLGESTAERLVAGRQEGGPWAMGVEATTDEQGAFELVGLLEHEYALYALDPNTLSSATPVIARAGAADVVLRLESAKTRRRVAGRVVSLAGASLADVRVALGRRVVWERPTPRPIAGWDRSPLPPPAAVQTFLDRYVKTDAEGRFAFEAIHVEHASLNLTGSPILLAELVSLDDHPNLEELEIVIEVSCRFIVVLEDPGEADAFGRVDETGRTMPLFIQLESHTISTPDVEIVEGRSGIARIGEGSCTLVLMKDGTEVRRVVVTLEPGGVQEIRL
ncbi:MAG: hypothetical protein O7B99_13445, partial [Planctomycetota bacterium]|nr:hypothetical protein [Planctomycetota bacterium]